MRSRRILSTGIASAMVFAGLIGFAEGAEAAPVSPQHAAKIAEMRRLSAHHVVRHASAAKSQPAPAAVARAVAAVSPQDDPPVGPPASSDAVLTITGTNGELTLSATTSAAYVQFQFAGAALGAPVAVVGSAASVPFASWGYTNDVHSFAVLDCTTADATSCAAAPGPQGNGAVQFDNAPPVITAPAANATISGGFSVAASSDGGGVRFDIDGTPVGFDSAAPYTFAYTGSALSAGGHSVRAVQCTVDQRVCDGPTSASVAFTSDSLHPRISALTPATFSPNGDRHYDASKLTFVLPDSEYAVITIKNSHGTVVRGPVNLGKLATGAHSWVWNGRSQTNHAVPSGRYTVAVNTTARVNGVAIAGMASKAAIVDLQAPVASGTTTSGSVYPYRDGFHDTLVVKFGLNERAAVRLTILDSKHRAIRAVTATRAAGMTSMTWDARDSRGKVVKAGTYAWTLTLTDSVGNAVHGASHRLGVSAAHLVSKTVTITRNGDSFSSAGGSDPNCSGASTKESDYAHGLWLVNACEGTEGADVAAGFYDVALPAATVYNHLNVQVNGFSENFPTSIETGFGVAGGNSDFGIPGFHEITSTSKGWYNLGTETTASKYVSARHHALVVVSVDSYDAPDDFDVNQVRISLSYQILK